MNSVAVLFVGVNKAQALFKYYSWDIISTSLGGTESGVKK